MLPAQLLPPNIAPGSSSQRHLVNVLSSHGYFLRHPGVIETHISWVLLSGHDAYKIKKAVDLGFLDFSSLKARNYYCDEELRLNRRLAPDIYLNVLPIGGTPEEPVLGKMPAIEYAVHMRRFSPSGLMDRMSARARITPDHIDKLAAIIAAFHNTLPAAAKDSPFCAVAVIEKAALGNFALLQQTCTVHRDIALLKLLGKASTEEFSACLHLFQQRAAAGCIRECHGDMHLGNIVVLNDVPTPFDGIEFNAALRWIDVISEISFPVMDLLRHGQPQLAWRLLNGYLENTGDYSGCGVLRFYLAYRAMVRAKIAAISSGQRPMANKAQQSKSLHGYLGLAYDILTRRRPVLIITHGLPGCGKSTFAQIALEKLGAIRIRSDVERKRLFGLTALADSDALTGEDIYGEDATRRTYERLHVLARDVIAAGFPVIVDAAFLRRAEREIFRTLAHEMAVPFVIASLRADTAAMAQRLEQRNNRHNDASEAGITVLQKLRVVQEPLLDQERVAAVTFVNNGDVDALRSAVEGWKSLDAYLA
ncbi:MAG: Aminoglycoside phosphotransferase [Candidatus Gallionella acididurans]|uniref:Aminoglycoside phosphotransferase n=1 Tax=Candidatus Gallionella acididurans TaxID=1796491 RepID=A0A139BRQ7_9PROT|nr:MAG: Aminoglycoside phosphotransferase [Candidatus Gallionella acididurans]